MIAVRGDTNGNDVRCHDDALGRDEKADGNEIACIKSNIKKGHKYMQMTNNEKTGKRECYGGRCKRWEGEKNSIVYDISSCMRKRKFIYPTEIYIFHS